jgi:hypothetical protein
MCRWREHGKWILDHCVWSGLWRSLVSRSCRARWAAWAGARIQAPRIRAVSPAVADAPAADVGRSLAMSIPVARAGSYSRRARVSSHNLARPAKAASRLTVFSRGVSSAHKVAVTVAATQAGRVGACFHLRTGNRPGRRWQDVDDLIEVEIDVLVIDGGLAFHLRGWCGV